MTLKTEKLEWFGYGKKVLKMCLSVSTESTNVTNKHTHRQTPHDGRPRLASRATPDYGLGTVGKCLGPTTSKGPTKDGCKIC